MSLTRHGDEILVNSATEGGQMTPQVARLADGGFVITWQDSSGGVGGATGDPSAPAVKAQVFAPDGTPRGGEILVNTATADFQMMARVAALPGGGFVVTWQDFSEGVGGAGGDASLWAIKAQVFAADGTPLGGEIRVNTATADYQVSAQVTALSGGGFAVTWMDYSQGVGGATGDASGWAVKAQVFAADGTPVGGEILVNTATAGDQTGAKITALSGGGFVVTWNDSEGDAPGDAVKAQVFGADGAPVGGEILVNTATEDAQELRAVTALSNGGFVVTWSDYSAGVGGATGDGSGIAVKAQVFAADGTPVGGEILVNTATEGSQTGAAITALSNGGFVVSWRDESNGVGGAAGDTSGGAIKAQVFAADGTPVGDEILVNTATEGAQSSAKIAALPNGGFVVAWSDFSQGVGGASGDASGWAVKAQAFGPDGVRVGGEILVNSATEGDQWTPEIAVLTGGRVVVTWEDFSEGIGGASGDASGYAVKAQVLQLAQPSGPRPVPTTGGAGSDVAILSGGANTYAAGDGADIAAGEGGDDYLHGNLGNDTLYGGQGSDTLRGGQDQDLLFGEAGADRLFGDRGNDVVHGGTGDDVIDGGDGDDAIRGGQGNDWIEGGAGADWLSGDRGADTLSGGAGADVFHLFLGADFDVVADFNAAEGDRVQVLGPYTLSQEGEDVVIHLDAASRLTLLGVQLSSLPEGWIVG